LASLTQLIQKLGTGDQAARDELFAAAYDELRKLARSRLRDGGRKTFLDTTALVHESYLKLPRQQPVAPRRSPCLLCVRVTCHALGDHRRGA
jgi:DNA-directed RNA polymerase specialized sigma24 family protein